MGVLRLTRGGVLVAEVPVARQSAWPFAGVPEPVMPTGLAVDTSGVYKGQGGREYRGGTFDATVKEKRIVFRDARFSWFGVMNPAEDVWFVNCDIGPRGGGIHPMVVPQDFGQPVAKRVVFDGCQFHGMHQGTANDHTEGLQVGGVEVLWVKNCRFYDNHVMDMMLRCWSPSTIRWVVIENCVLERTGTVGGGEAFYSLLIAGSSDSTKPTDVLVRNNRIGMPISVDPTAVRVTLQNNTAI